MTTMSPLGCCHNRFRETCLLDDPYFVATNALIATLDNLQKIMVAILSAIF